MTKLPLTVGIEDAREGKESALWNALKEVDEAGELVAVRPGLETVRAVTGAGNGVVCFGGGLISVFGTSCREETSPASLATVVNGIYDFAQSPL